MADAERTRPSRSMHEVLSTFSQPAPKPAPPQRLPTFTDFPPLPVEDDPYSTTVGQSSQWADERTFRPRLSPAFQTKLTPSTPASSQLGSPSRESLPRSQPASPSRARRDRRRRRSSSRSTRVHPFFSLHSFALRAGAHLRCLSSPKPSSATGSARRAAAKSAPSACLRTAPKSYAPTPVRHHPLQQGCVKLGVNLIEPVLGRPVPRRRSAGLGQRPLAHQQGRHPFRFNLERRFDGELARRPSRRPCSHLSVRSRPCARDRRCPSSRRHRHCRPSAPARRADGRADVQGRPPPARPRRLPDTLPPQPLPQRRLPEPARARRERGTSGDSLPTAAAAAAGLLGPAPLVAAEPVEVVS